MFSKLVGSKASSNSLKSKEDTWNATVKSKVLPRTSLADSGTSGIRETLGAPGKVTDDGAGVYSTDDVATPSKEQSGEVRVNADAAHSPVHVASEPASMSSGVSSDSEHAVNSVNDGGSKEAPTPPHASAADESAMASFLDSEDEDDDRGNGDGGFVEAVPDTQTHAGKEQAKMASFLDSDDDDDDDDARKGQDHGTFRAAPPTSKASMPGVDGKSTTGIDGSVNLHNDNDNGAANTGVKIPTSQPSAGSITPAKKTATTLPAADEVASFLNASDEEDADMHDRLMPALSSAASGKASVEQTKMKSFLDNSDDEEDDERESSVSQQSSPSLAARMKPKRPGKNSRLKKITHADADDLLGTLDAAGLTFAPAGVKSSRVVVFRQPPGIGASDKPPSILKLNQFNKEAGQTLFQNLFRKR